jgi:hypothetical protein
MVSPVNTAGTRDAAYWVMMRIIGLLLAGVFATGCIAEVDGPGVAYAGPNVAVTATTVSPDLVYVSPGVQVVYGWNEPVFYVDGYYWRESGGIWYRSSYHTHGWYSYSAPRAVYSIQNRHAYRNYRPAHYTPRSRSYTNNRPDHRGGTTYRNNRPDARSYNTHTNNRPDARPVQKSAPAKSSNRPAQTYKKK